MLQIHSIKYESQILSFFQRRSCVVATNLSYIVCECICIQVRSFDFGNDKCYLGSTRIICTNICYCISLIYKGNKDVSQLSFYLNGFFSEYFVWQYFFCLFALERRVYPFYNFVRESCTNYVSTNQQFVGVLRFT